MIVSALVAMTLITIMMTAMAQMITNNERSMNSVRRRNDFEEIKVSLRQILQSPSLCPQALLNADSKKLKLSFSKLPASVPAFSSGGTGLLIDLRSGIQRKPGELEVTSLEIAQLSLDGDYVFNGQPVKRYTVELRLSARQPAGSFGAQSFSSSLAGLAFYVDGNNETVACGADVVAQRVRLNNQNDDDDHDDQDDDSQGENSSKRKS